MENPNISAKTKRKTNKFNSFNDEDNTLESNNSGDSQYYISNYLFDKVFNQQDEKINEVKIELSELKNELKNGFENKWKTTDNLIKDINQKISKIYTKEEIDNSRFISHPPKWAWGLIITLASFLASFCGLIIGEKYNEFLKVKENIEKIQLQLLDIQYKDNYDNPAKRGHVKSKP